MAKALPLSQIPVFDKNHLPTPDSDFSEAAIFLINKPKGWTSFDVVKFIRSRINVKKTGHAGTLDPMATGLLVLCCGRATKSISQIQEMSKVYRAEITFGASTASYDAETEVTEKASYDHITLNNIEDAMASHFSGEIDQVPPMYSALKKDGKKLYELARKGVEVEREPREVTIYDYEILAFKAPILEIKIHCSKGTYMRSLAHDLGNILDSKAHLSALERSAIGTFQSEQALSPHEFGDLVEKDG